MIDRRGFLVLSALGTAAGVAGACATKSPAPTAEEASSKPVEVALNAAEI